MAKEIIKIYAPCDGEVGDLPSLNDGVFSEGMLGIGAYIIPTSNVIYSPVQGVCLQIFDTKHAIHLQDQNGNTVLIHVGLDSVKLEGKGFDLQVEPNQKVDLIKPILKVDFKLFDEEKISKATPIVIDQNFDSTYEIKSIKTGSVKHGELILEIEKEKSLVKEIKSSVDSEGHVLPIIYADEWTNLSKLIYDNVGGSQNILRIYRCYTRLRLNIDNLKIIDVEPIKKHHKVRGVNIAGNELQIIIGQEVTKAKDNFVDYNEKAKAGLESVNIKKKTSFKTKLSRIVNEIFIPIIPVLCAASIMMVIASILKQAQAIYDVQWGYVTDTLGTSQPVYTIVHNIGTGGSDLFVAANLGSILMYVLSQTVWGFIGIYFCFNTVKFLKGNPLMGILLGMTLMSPFLFGGFSIELFKIGTGETIDKGGSSFVIAFKAYPNTLLPHIVCAIIYVYMDRWVKKWIPSSLDLIVRPALTYGVAVLSIFFLLGPILTLLEAGLMFVVFGVGQIPYGIGAGIFATVWQAIVVTGLHTFIYIPINMGINQTREMPQILLGFVNNATGAFGQIGAALALIFITKDSKLRQLAIASAPAAFFAGVTEPIVFGTNLPKFWPFIAGSIGSGIGTLYAGATGAVANTSIGGILFLLGQGEMKAGVTTGGTWNLVNSIISLAICVGVGFGLTFVLYHEKINPAKESKKLIKVMNLINKSNGSSLELTNTELVNIYSKENLELMDHLNKAKFKKDNLNVKVEKLNQRAESKRTRFSKLANKAYDHKKWTEVEKYNELINTFTIDTSKYDEQISQYQTQMDQLNNQYLEISKKAQEKVNLALEQNKKTGLWNDAQMELATKTFNQIIDPITNKQINKFSVRKYKKLAV